jgi:hypothetical protein
VASQEFGYHYLQNVAAPVYPKIQNKGGYEAAADLIRLNMFVYVTAWESTKLAHGFLDIETLFGKK